MAEIADQQLEASEGGGVPVTDVPAARAADWQPRRLEALTAGDRIAAALRGLDGPTPLLRAPAGMFGQPPGLIPEELAAVRRS
jgi:hypothetical protein